MPRILLQIEGAALLILSTWLYFRLDYPWWLFLLLLLFPDLSALGYLAGTRAGSISYNAFHTVTLPLTVGILAWLGGGWSILVLVSLVWLAHIGMDRMVGYGLKYSDDFKHHHFNEI
jgi:hypothetical protein